MKKTYISPATNAINVHFEGMIASSPTGVSVNHDDEISSQSELLSNKKDYSSEIWGE